MTPQALTARSAVPCQFPGCWSAAAMIELVPAGRPYADGATDLLHVVGGIEGTLRISGFLPHANVSTDVPDYPEVTRAVRAADDVAATLHERDIEWAPFFCGTCERSYCADHWRLEPVYDDAGFDFYAGSCPYGHHHMIDH